MRHSIDDTIAAIATPAGRGGIGIVRLSGANAWDIVGTFAKPLKGDASESLQDFMPWRARLCELNADDGAVIDRAVITCYLKPHSYTAEDVIEIACHGSPVVLNHVLELCLRVGARLAEPGEFTMRAFLNGRIDLAQAEAVRDLIEARTFFQAKIAAQQAEGSVARWITPVKQQLTDLIAMLEAGIDFAEDDVSIMPTSEIIAGIDAILMPLRQSREKFSAARIIHDGLTLAIVGRPNVGKSSLFNRLIEQDRAIVTASPGTTRDLVSETVEIEGIPLRCVDTAGIREAFDEAEAIGIQKSQEAAVDSDLTLVVIDGSVGLLSEDRAVVRRVIEGGKLLVVINKCDLKMPLSEAEMVAQICAIAGLPIDIPIQVCSAKSGKGITNLRRSIIDAAAPALGGSRESAMLTNLRHQQAVEAAYEALLIARTAAEADTPHEMFLLDLYSAVRSLDELTGATTNEDILSKIFSTFCIGK